MPNRGQRVLCRRCRKGSIREILLWFVLPVRLFKSDSVVILLRIIWLKTIETHSLKLKMLQIQ